MITRFEDQSKSVCEYMRGGKDYVQLSALSKSLPPNAKLFSKLTLVPGASIGYHTHYGESELIYFLEGCGRVQDDDKFYDVSAGDSTCTVSGHGHGIENTGMHDLILLAVIIKD